MATLKQRLHRKNSSGTYDTIHLETGADCITGTLGVSNGGTGRSTLTSGYFLRGNGTGAVTMSSVDQVKSALGIDDSSQSDVTMKMLFETGTLYNPYGETVADLNSSVSVGSVVVFDGKLWRVVHKSGSVVYLASQYCVSSTQFDSGGSSVYKGSDLANVAMTYQNNIMSSGALAQCNNVTVNSVTAKVFVCSYEQVNGGFSYFGNNINRALCNIGGDGCTWRISSANGPNNVWFVDTGGRLEYEYPTGTRWFRPFVALQL